MGNYEISGLSPDGKEQSKCDVELDLLPCPLGHSILIPNSQLELSSFAA